LLEGISCEKILSAFTCSYVIFVHPQAGADVNCTNPETPLAIATTNGLTECAEYFLEVATNIYVPVKHDTDISSLNFIL
jgi:hypothetical protein